MSLERAERALAILLRVLAYGGGAVILGLVGLVVVEVFMRYVLRQPILGGFEITELAMVLIVSLGLPYCALTGGHVTIDLFGRWLDRPRLRWVNVAVNVAGAVLLGVVAWRASLYALGSYSWGDLSNMMRIPKYPFQLAVAASAVLFALVLLLDAVKAARGPHRSGPGAP